MYAVLAGGDDHAGAEHEFWKGWLFTELRKLGFDVQAEHPLANGHRVDLLVQHDTTTAAIEVETGKSDVSTNVKAIRAAGIGRMVLVAIPNNEALAAIRLLAGVDQGSIMITSGARLTAEIDTLVGRWVNENA